MAIAMPFLSALLRVGRLWARAGAHVPMGGGSRA